ncbi:MAG: DUF2167 domain-containing protein [Gemmatimonadales bacterium]
MKLSHSVPATVVLLAVLPLVAPAQEQGESIWESIPWAQGPITGKLGAEAQVKVPAGCLFTGQDGMKKFMEMTQNPLEGNERGVVICEVETNPWFVIFAYDPSGYVRDDEGGRLDADAILSSIRRGTEAANRERRKRGWGTLEVEGWMTQPHYDQATNNLTWALTGKTSEGERNVNHSVRLLGRGGVMHLDLVSDPEHFAVVVPKFNAMVTGFAYTAGNRYAEWRQGDRVAEYGLTALVAGGAGVALVKSGLLAKFWKVIVLGIAALVGAIKSLWSKITGRRGDAPQS